MKSDAVVTSALTESRDFLKHMVECLADVGAPENAIEVAMKDERLMRHLAKEWANRLLPPSHVIQTQKESLEQILVRINGGPPRTNLSHQWFGDNRAGVRPEAYEVAAVLSDQVDWDFRPRSVSVQPLPMQRRMDSKLMTEAIARRGFAYCDLKTFLSCVADHVPSIFMPFHNSGIGYRYMRTIVPTKDGKHMQATFLVTWQKGACYHVTFEKCVPHSISTNDVLLLVPESTATVISA